MIGATVPCCDRATAASAVIRAFGVPALTTKISAYQSMASNERGQIALVNAQAQAAMHERQRY